MFLISKVITRDYESLGKSVQKKKKKRIALVALLIRWKLVFFSDSCTKLAPNKIVTNVLERENKSENAIRGGVTGKI